MAAAFAYGDTILWLVIFKNSKIPIWTDMISFKQAVVIFNWRDNMRLIIWILAIIFLLIGLITPLNIIFCLLISVILIVVGFWFKKSKGS